MELMNPYGTWAQVDGKWAFTPLDHEAPYTNGRWLYTEYGWYWQGTAPHSWLTEHYGYWKRGADKRLGLVSGPVWLPQTVEIRARPRHRLAQRRGGSGRQLRRAACRALHQDR